MPLERIGRGTLAASGQAVIRPSDTRRYLIQQLEIHEMRLSGGIGRHRMAAWPATY